MFLYIIAVVLTNELANAADQCPDFQFKSPFLPGESCEGIYTKNLESRDNPGYYWILSREYCGMSYTGSSCEEIYTKYPETQDMSGYYRINNDWAYCNMTSKADPDEYLLPQCGDGGWKRIAHIDISTGDDCPTGWLKSVQSGVSFCRVASNNRGVCSSATFSTGTTSYQKVCGRARGYQKGFTWGFIGLGGSTTIESVYASGLSITHGDPRQHIWTFACGFSDAANGDQANCPCEARPGTSTDSFVGNDYYCESGAKIPSMNTFYFDDPLWDGAGCNAQSNCCDIPNQPWFSHQLNQPTQDDIEARICTVGPFERSSVLVDLLELYVQ